MAEENKDKVVKKFKTLSNNDELVNTNGMWNLKRKMFPKNKETLPFAKQDFNGKLISSQKNLKILSRYICSQTKEPSNEGIPYMVEKPKRRALFRNVKTVQIEEI